MKKLSVVIISSILFLSISTPTMAHVVVRPSEVGVAQRTNFSVSVPTEESVPTVGLRLVIPEGLKSVRPNVKPGWTIEIKKEGEGENARVTELIWTGGSIPADQRDEFVFSAQAPAEASTLQWKAYQTYESGLEVAWDADPKMEKEHKDGTVEESHPYSETQVVNDVTAVKETSAKTSDKTNDLLVVGVVAAFIMSAASLWMQSRKK